MAMKLKTTEVDGKSYALVDDNGCPIYVDDTTGKEIGFDAPQAMTRISSLNNEAKTNRERYERAETKLESFSGIEDPEAAKSALEKLKDIDDGKLLQAGEVEKIRNQARAAAEESVKQARVASERSLQEKQEELDKLSKRYRSERIGNAFAKSKFISEKVAVPVDMFQATFGNHFDLDDDGNITAKNSDGSAIASLQKFGEPAEFEEAIEILVNNYPYRDSIMKGSGAQGSGTRPGKANGGAKTMSRAEFDRMGQSERAAKFKEGYRISE